MSNSVLTSVFENSKSKGVARLVLLVIADRADDSGTAWPGSEFIAERANIDRPNVYRALRELVELGELTIDPRKGPKFANLYRISDRITTIQSQGDTVSPRQSGSIMVIQNQYHGDTQSQGSHIDPNKRETFVSKLKNSPTYSGVDVEREAMKARDWIAKNMGRRFTERFFVSWLNRVKPSKTPRTGGGVVLESGYKGPVRL